MENRSIKHRLPPCLTEVIIVGTHEDIKISYLFGQQKDARFHLLVTTLDTRAEIDVLRWRFREVDAEV